MAGAKLGLPFSDRPSRSPRRAAPTPTIAEILGGTIWAKSATAPGREAARRQANSSGAQCFRDGPVPLYPALYATSQNPMIFGQQVPRDIWESHARGFWMKSTSNMESMCLKLVLLFQN